MSAKDAEPAVQDGMRDRIGIIDLLYRHRVGIVQPQYVQDERQGILSVRDECIRQDGMSVAAAAAYPGDPEPVVYWLSVLNLHHATLIVGKDPALTFCTAVGTTFQSRIETPHVVFIVLRDGNIQKKELAIDQVLPYHNSALKAMLSLDIRAMTLCEAWRCIEEGQNLCRDGALPLFLLSVWKTITESSESGKKKVRRVKRHTLADKNVETEF